MDEHKLLHELYVTFITTNEQMYLRKLNSDITR